MHAGADRASDAEPQPRHSWAGKRKRVVGGMGITLESLPDVASGDEPEGPLLRHPTIHVTMDGATGDAEFRPEFPTGPGTFADGRSMTTGAAEDPIPHGMEPTPEAEPAAEAPEPATPEPVAAAAPAGTWPTDDAEWQAAHGQAQAQVAHTYAQWQAALAAQQRLAQAYEQHQAAQAYQQWQVAQGHAQQAAEAYNRHVAQAREQQRAADAYGQQAAQAQAGGGPAPAG